MNLNASDGRGYDIVWLVRRSNADLARFGAMPKLQRHQSNILYSGHET